MIRVFEDFDYMKVGQIQSVLESHDIRTFLKNQFGFGGTGELPFIETVPQLFVLNEQDVARARQIISETEEAITPGSSWACPECGTEIEGHFTECWNCAEGDEKKT